MDVATYFCLYGLRIVNVLKSASSLTSRLTFNDVQRDAAVGFSEVISGRTVLMSRTAYYCKVERTDMLTIKINQYILMNF